MILSSQEKKVIIWRTRGLLRFLCVFLLYCSYIMLSKLSIDIDFFCIRAYIRRRVYRENKVANFV